MTRLVDGVRGLAECWGDSTDLEREVHGRLLAAADEIDRLTPVAEAARAWRADLIPNTSTSSWSVARALAIAVDQLDCDHPRAQRLHHNDGRRDCGRCGAALAREAPTPEPEPA